MTFRHPIFFLTAFVLPAAAQLYTAPFGPGGTWNLYEYTHQATWNDAKRLAEESTPPAGKSATKGHLVSFSSIAENQFVRSFCNRQSVWIGLTDDERFGGHEAGSHPRNGWKWLTGESLTFSNWKPNEPDDWMGEGTGEDAVMMERYGRWTDGGIGVAGQTGPVQSYVIEWETHSPGPVEGAIPMSRTWPADDMMPPFVSGKWSARWVSGYANSDNSNSFRQPRTIQEAAPLLSKDAKAGTANGKQRVMIQQEGNVIGSTPWLWIATQDSNRQGWLPGTGEEGLNFQGLPQRNNYIGAVVGKIHVEKPGNYTFAVTAEDAFALRIGGLKWKSTSGDGYIDPLDPLTFTQPNGTFSAKALGVIELPAGDHLVEALWMVETTGSEFHVLSAPGAYLTEGATTEWRPLGHAAEDWMVPTLGITDEGWTVDCSAPPQNGKKTDPKPGLQDGLIRLELDLDRISKSGLASINFSDAPETNITHFPDATRFPNEKQGSRNENWPLRAHARLVVPKDGKYQIGLHAAGLGALRIKGGMINRVSQAAQGLKGLNQQEDSFDFEGQKDNNSEPKIFTEWTLNKGEYEIEVFYVKHTGPASLAVFSCPTGPYPPGILTTGGAKLTADFPGLPHATR